MPAYSYQCNSCRHEFDNISTIAKRRDIEEEVCPECGKADTVKLTITSPPIIGYSIAPNLRISDGFNDRLKDIKKRSGKTNTVGDAIK